MHNNFDVEHLVLDGNSAYYGGAIFVSADLSFNATFSNLTFTNNIAAEGKAYGLMMTRLHSALPSPETSRVVSKRH